MTINQGVPPEVAERLEQVIKEKEAEITKHRITISDLQEVREKQSQAYKELQASLAEAAKDDALFTEAEKLVQAGDFDRAEKLLLEAYNKRKAKSAETAFQLAKLQEMQLEYEEARKYYEEAVRLAPANSRYLNDLGLLLLDLADHKKALEYFEQALEIDRKAFGENHPAVAIRLNNIGLAYYALGDYAKSLEYSEQAERIFKEKLGNSHPYTKSMKGKIESARVALARGKQ